MIRIRYCSYLASVRSVSSSRRRGLLEQKVKDFYGLLVRTRTVLLHLKVCDELCVWAISEHLFQVLGVEGQRSLEESLN